MHTSVPVRVYVVDTFRDGSTTMVRLQHTRLCSLLGGCVIFFVFCAPVFFPAAGVDKDFPVQRRSLGHPGNLGLHEKAAESFPIRLFCDVPVGVHSGFGFEDEVRQRERKEKRGKNQK